MVKRLRVRLRSESGFGLLELLMAMVVVNIALLALVAAFAIGSDSLRRAGGVATAASLADKQLELYRALSYGSIALDSAAVGAADATYRGDAAWSASEVTTTCSTPLPAQCAPTQTVTGADGASYRVDTYVTTTATGGRTLKRVTVVVRDGTRPATELTRQASIFDAALG